MPTLGSKNLEACYLYCSSHVILYPNFSSKMDLHEPIGSFSQMGMYAWSFTTYGSTEAKGSQSLSCEKVIVH